MRRKLLMPDQLRGSMKPSRLKPKRRTCSFASFPISSGSCPVSAFPCTAVHFHIFGASEVQKAFCIIL